MLQRQTPQGVGPGPAGEPLQRCGRREERLVRAQTLRVVERVDPVGLGPSVVRELSDCGRRHVPIRRDPRVPGGTVHSTVWRRSGQWASQYGGGCSRCAFPAALPAAAVVAVRRAHAHVLVLQGRRALAAALGRATATRVRAVASSALVMIAPAAAVVAVRRAHAHVLVLQGRRALAAALGDAVATRVGTVALAGRRHRARRPSKAGGRVAHADLVDAVAVVIAGGAGRAGPREGGRGGPSQGKKDGAEESGQEGRARDADAAGHRHGEKGRTAWDSGHTTVQF